MYVRAVASCLQVLVQNNHLSDRIVVLEGKMEDVNCPEMVDVIISEPIGYMLLSERTLESFLYARKWLRPNGKRSDQTSLRMMNKWLELGLGD